MNVCLGKLNMRNKNELRDPILENKERVAVVTGSSSGIGLETSVLLVLKEELYNFRSFLFEPIANKAYKLSLSYFFSYVYPNTNSGNTNSEK
jgi:hypothetical protein